METVADRIIAKFGGTTKCAKALGHRFPSTVQQWKSRGVIPARQQQAVLDTARREGIALQPNDFFESAPAEGEAA